MEVGGDTNASGVGATESNVVKTTIVVVHDEGNRIEGIFVFVFVFFLSGLVLAQL